MFAAVRSAALLGVEGHPVSVEVHVGAGLPSFTIVGLPDDVCRESRDRVRAAVSTSKLSWPATRVTVNLAPANQRKGGSGLDLAIAIGVLVAQEQVPPDVVERHAFIGELGLDGSLRPVPGVVPLVAALGRPGADPLRPVVPAASHHEASIVSAEPVCVASTLTEVVAALRGDAPWPDPPPDTVHVDPAPPPDLADVRGQPLARQAIEVSAAGGHHLLMVGPPGAGKTMLAQRLIGVLPALTPDDALSVTMIHSAAAIALPPGGLVTQPPFRAPHHSISYVAMVGGGTAALRPGEISLAHCGVLFLDELGEFASSVLDTLRQPLEDGVVRIARARNVAEMPCRFLLVAATNPCPCGGGPPGACRCDTVARGRYLRRLSDPLLDRFDLRVPVTRPGIDELLTGQPGEPTAVVAARVARARAIAVERNGCLNAELPASRLDACASLSPDASSLLRHELERFRLTGRGYHRVRRVARTLADLDESPGEQIEAEHVALALQFRVQMLAAGRAA